MPYIGKNTLIARPMSTPLSGAWDVLESIGKGALNVFQSGEQAKGAAAVLQAQQAAQQAQMQDSGISTGTLLMIGALGIGAVLLLKKKKDG